MLLATSLRGFLYVLLVRNGTYYFKIPFIPIDRFSKETLEGFQITKDIISVVIEMDLIDPLFDAVVKGDESVVNHIASLGISLNVNDEDGLTVLHW